ncbi:hypothetical protein EMCRGX_G024229 [Ephydatia muelleri]
MRLRKLSRSGYRTPVPKPVCAFGSPTPISSDVITWCRAQPLRVSPVANFVLDVGEAGKEPDIPSPLMYTWHGKHYLGAAHGLAGIMTVLLQVYGLVPSLQPRIFALVKPCVDYLLSLKMPSGNFPSSLESAGTDKLVHWCHGAAGVVHMFAHAYRVFGDRKYLDAAVDCREVVWDQGLLRKGYGLCHGVVGNAHTFLQLDHQPEYFNRTVKFAEWCLSSSERKCRIPDHPYLLFEGLAGTALFYTDMVHHPSNAFYPAFELPPVLGDRKYLDAAVDCEEVVWDQGLLRKGYGLCHGVAGNAHTFLQLFRLTTRPEYFNRAVKVCKCVWQMCEGVEIGGMQQQESSCSTQFAEWCLSSSEWKCRVPDHPYSLFEGLARTAFYTGMVHNPLDAFYLAFELPPVTS